MKYLIIILLTIFLFLQYKIWFASGNILTLQSFAKVIESQNNSNQLQQAYNNKLENEINEIKYGENIIEEKAREELGMIKDGELYYQFSNS